MCCLMKHVYMHSFRSIIKATEKFLVIFPGVGAFEQLFGPVRGEFEQKVIIYFKCSGKGMLKVQFEWYISMFCVV